MRGRVQVQFRNSRWDAGAVIFELVGAVAVLECTLYAGAGTGAVLK